MTVYFFCVATKDPSDAHYQHEVVCLAEGLQKLGVRCVANIDYWPLDENRATFLLNHDPEIAADDADVVVVSEDWSLPYMTLPAAVTKRKRNYLTIFLDRQDGTQLTSFRPEFRAVDIILRAQYSRSVQYPGNFVPWAYGPSERIIAMTSGSSPVRRTALTINLRHGLFPQTVRIEAERRIYPKLLPLFPFDERRDAHDAAPPSKRDEMYWFETGRRHTPSYYERLRDARASAAFCGYFAAPWPHDKSTLASRIVRRAFEALHRPSNVVVQWDSWRFWESLAAGVATLHLDARKYGFVFPVEPTNWEHYIGFDLDRIDEAVERLRDDDGVLERVGSAGRSWALEHYSPLAVARRFLGIVAARGRRVTLAPVGALPE